MSQTADIRFGTDGWRAVIGEGFTADNVNRVVAGVARYLLENGSSGGSGSKGPVLIGYDTRKYSPQMARLAAQVLATHGIEATFSLSPIPTPAVAEAVVRLGYSAGLMITASHNPPNFNGIKYRPWYGGSPTDDITRLIEQHVPAEPIKIGSAGKTRPLVNRMDLLNGYLSYLSKQVNFPVLSRYPGIVVVDSMYGATQGLAALVVRLSDVAVREIHRVHVVAMRGTPPEPIPPHINTLMKTVGRLGKNGRPVIGLALDGDGDRIGAVDERGRFVNSHQIFALLLDYLAGDLGHRGRVMKTVSTTTLIDRLGAHYGMPVEVTPVGFKYLCSSILQGDVIMAGEESGGLYLQGSIPERDGIMAGLRLLEMLAHRGCTLGEAIDDLERRFGSLRYTRTDLPLVPERANIVREHVSLWSPPELAGSRVMDRVDIDGLKLVREDGSWLMVRPSGTEPMLRIYAEAATEAEAEALIKEGVASLPAGSVR